MRKTVRPIVWLALLTGSLLAVAWQAPAALAQSGPSPTPIRTPQAPPVRTVPPLSTAVPMPTAPPAPSSVPLSPTLPVPPTATSVPGAPSACDTRLTVDSPRPGATVSGAVLVRGWALDIARPDGGGISQVHLYADGPAGVGMFLGAATLGAFRPDVDAVFRRPSSQPGWSLIWDLGNIPPGPHTVHFYAEDACGWNQTSQELTISPVTLVVDRPSLGAALEERQPLSVSGWAVDPTAAAGAGIVGIDIYLDGEEGIGRRLGSTPGGLPRPDVAAVLSRPSAGNAGYSIDVPATDILPGAHTIYVYVRTATGATYRAIPITVTAAPGQYTTPPQGRLFPSGGTGYDISWPQCGGPLPSTPYDVAIVGVTGGRAFYENACLAQQFSWARAAIIAPSVYINLNAPSGRTIERGRSGPARGVCRVDDLACRAHNFGYNAATHAVAYARSQGVTATFWWLDVETENTWDEDRALNARVVQGAIDSLRDQGLGVGIYSTGYQWGEITGQYRPGVPVWVAGARNLAEAATFCTSSFAFGRGPVVLIQYPEGPYDGAYAC